MSYGAMALLGMVLLALFCIHYGTVTHEEQRESIRDWVILSLPIMTVLIGWIFL